jgi:hypothetical protein
MDGNREKRAHETDANTGAKKMGKKVIHYEEIEGLAICGQVR